MIVDVLKGIAPALSRIAEYLRSSLLMIMGRLLVSPCCRVDTSFVIRLRISPWEVVLKYFCGTRFIFCESSPRIR